MTHRLLSGVIVSFEGPLTPSLETLLRQARLRQASRQLFPIHLAIQVRK